MVNWLPKIGLSIVKNATIMLTSFALSHEYTMLPVVWEHGGFLVVWLLLVFFSPLPLCCFNRGASAENRTLTSGSGVRGLPVSDRCEQRTNLPL